MHMYIRIISLMSLGPQIQCSLSPSLPLISHPPSPDASLPPSLSSFQHFLVVHELGCLRHTISITKIWLRTHSHKSRRNKSLRGKGNL